MSNIDSTNSRPSFFPRSSTADKAGQLKGTYFKRNTDARKNQLNQMAERDSKVNIPEAVKDFSRIKKAVDMAPEVDNTDKIAKLKQQIQAGTYKVDYDGLADKILSQEFQGSV